MSGIMGERSSTKLVIPFLAGRVQRASQRKKKTIQKETDKKVFLIFFFSNFNSPREKA
jgi:hypothetical protein